MIDGELNKSPAKQHFPKSNNARQTESQKEIGEQLRKQLEARKQAEAEEKAKLDKEVKPVVKKEPVNYLKMRE